MVDAPPREGVVTKAEAEARGLRPYFVHLKPTEVLGWRAETTGGVTYLSQFRVMETVKEQDPEDEFVEKEVEQIRVLTLADGRVGVRLYRQANETDKWQQVDEFQTDATEITVAPFYAARTGFMAAEPPLQDIADLNVAHWQSASDQRNILHFARVPILAASGYDEEGDIVISAGVATKSRSPDFKMQWVEHSGAAIGSGRDDLKDLEFQMQALGLQLLVARQETATGAALDAKKETAPLAMMADQLKDTLERCLAWLSEYQGSPQVYTVGVNKDFGVSGMSAQEFTAMLSAVNTGNLSRETFWREMARRGVIRDDIDPEEERQRIEDDDDGLMDGIGQPTAS